MDIKIEQLSDEEITRRGIRSWPVWEKEASRFEWFYDQTEEFLLLEGRVTVETEAGRVSFGKGDFVTLPRGLRCVWDIKEDVKKHYNLR